METIKEQRNVGCFYMLNCLKWSKKGLRVQKQPCQSAELGNLTLKDKQNLDKQRKGISMVRTCTTQGRRLLGIRTEKGPA
jgi:hypothetical protein